MDGLAWGGGFGGEEGGGGPFAFVGFGHGGWWGKVRVEIASECYGSCCCWDVVVDDAVVVVVVVVSHSQAKWMDV